MELRPIFKQYSPFLKILLFVIIIFVSLLFTSLIGLLIGMAIFGPNVAGNLPSLKDMADPAIIAQLKYFQVISQLGLFIFPVIIFVLLVSPAKERITYLNLSPKVKIVPLLVAASILLVGLPVINWLAELNMQMKLPGSMAGLEDWMQKSESSAALLTSSFLSGGKAGEFIVNLFMIAIIPAIGEELLFRGVLQRLFKEWTKNIHAAIWITAAIFSFIHFQFYGFLPRLLLGVLFGYMLYWSGSLWVPILAHFINNVTAVIVAYLAATGVCDLDFNTFGSTNNPWIIAGSAIIVCLLVFLLWLRRRKEVIKISTSQTPDL